MITSVGDMMLRLARIDRKGLTVRDVLILWCVIKNGGQSSSDIKNQLGFAEHSALQSCFQRLPRLGLIVNEQDKNGRGIPTRWFITKKGEETWASIVPIAMEGVGG